VAGPPLVNKAHGPLIELLQYPILSIHVNNVPHESELLKGFVDLEKLLNRSFLSFLNPNSAQNSDRGGKI
jgi:hypothetical protein